MKLRECPFCGNKAKFGEHEGGEFIECVRCHVTGPMMFPEKCNVKPLLAERWNYRQCDYIPGEFKCPKCDFVCIKSVLNPETGQIGRTFADSLEECPNCSGERLVAVRMNDAVTDARDHAMRFAGEKHKMGLATKNLLMLCVRTARKSGNTDLADHAVRIAKEAGVEFSPLREEKP